MMPSHQKSALENSLPRPRKRQRSGRPELPAIELAEICRWIELNRDVIVEFWDGVITPDEAIARLRKLP